MKFRNIEVINDKKGFTLIELVAVILILGLISLIAVPTVVNIIQEAKEKSFKIATISIFQATIIYIYDNDYPDIPGEGLEVSLLDNLEPNIFITGYIFRNLDGNFEIVDVSDGNYCANGEKGNLVITKGACDLEAPI